MTAYFVTGTDTGVGKTLVSSALLHAFALRGLTTIGMKPVAAGLDSGGHQEDVAQLCAASSIKADIGMVNPYAFKNPIAPHLAAAAEGREIRFGQIHVALDTLLGLADIVVVEGVGGFRVPLGVEGDSADLAQTLGLPIILVVGMRLGCISHALLAVEAIQRRGLVLSGWVANSIDPEMLYRPENIASLRERIDSPLLGTIEYQLKPDPQQVARYLHLPRGLGR